MAELWMHKRNVVAPSLTPDSYTLTAQAKGR